MKAHGCGRRFTRKQWSELPLAYEQIDEEVRGEFRHCPCGSTIGVVRPRTRVFYRVEQTAGGFVVYRRVGLTGATVAVGLGSRAIVFSTRKAVEIALALERAADRIASSRLEVDLDDGEP